MSGRATLYLLLTVVAGAAAMLSFAALRDLAELCGFARPLAWLLPVVVDAGAAAGSLVWLGERTGEPARVFARRLALGLLGLSVAANALGHGLAAYLLAPPWWVVVVLSGIAPAVLGAMVHLAVLVGHDHPEPVGPEVVRPGPERPDLPWVDVDDEPIPYELARDLDETDVSEADAEPVEIEQVAVLDGRGLSPRWADAPAIDDAEDASGRAAVLIAAGAGRRRLSRELGVSEYEARRLLERSRPTTDTTPALASIDPGAVDTPTSTSEPVVTSTAITTGAQA